jgi:hypothetical protein
VKVFVIASKKSSAKSKAQGVAEIMDLWMNMYCRGSVLTTYTICLAKLRVYMCQIQLVDKREIRQRSKRFYNGNCLLSRV